MLGGETFAVKVNGGYEWQTGHTDRGGGSRINSYEIGISSSLTLPRLVAPGFIKRNRFDTHTTYQVGADLLNRPSYFRMLSASGSIAYRFQTSRWSFHDLTLFKLTYNRLLSTTDIFDELLEDRRALQQSFDDQFIPMSSYTYTYDRRVGHRRRDRFVWQISPTSAGNLFSGIYGLLGTRGEKKLFGLRFSQFVKLTNEVKYFKQVGGGTTLAMRLFAGAAYSYSNSGNLELPFSEQFAIGGANSIRAYTIRTVGPGSFRSDGKYGNLDQTGNFKLEANVELRIPIVAGIQGAVFFDAGNIWMMSKDPDRPGSLLKAETFLNNIATGTGAGVRYDLGFLVLRGDFGLGLHLPYNTGRRGYFNALRTKQARTFHLAIGYPF
jgi:outer membrane translocation and assembly module TamA